MRLAKLLVGGMVLASALPGVAATFSTEKWGEDTQECGSLSKPCLSISRAVSNAEAGDTVMVGPGIYVENIVVDKPGLLLLSTKGRFATVIQSNNKDQFIVRVRASSVQIGNRAQGFTLRGEEYGVGDTSRSTGISNVKVMGNRVTHVSKAGVFLIGSRHQIRFNEVVGSGGAGIHCSCPQVLLTDNSVFNSRSFGVFVALGDGGSIIQNLSEASGGEGFYISKASRLSFTDNVAFETNSDSIYFAGAKSMNMIRGNIASGGESGLHVRSQRADGNLQFVHDNLAVSNKASGFNLCLGEDSVVYRNTAASNGTGIALTGSCYVSGAAPSPAFRSNTTYSSAGHGLINSIRTSLNYRDHFFSPGETTLAAPPATSSGNRVTEPNSTYVTRASGL